MKSVSGKLPGSYSPNDLAKLTSAQTIDILPLTIAHVEQFQQPPKNNHCDPFDRLLAAIAIAENSVLLSQDTAFDSLGVSREWR